jgi:hypothetical protein
VEDAVTLVLTMSLPTDEGGASEDDSADDAEKDQPVDDCHGQSISTSRLATHHSVNFGVVLMGTFCAIKSFM